MSTSATPTNTTVRLPVSLVEQVRVVAQAHDRSLSAELRVALAAYVREQKKEIENDEHP
jgi:predicted transcriptional regulator